MKKSTYLIVGVIGLMLFALMTGILASGPAEADNEFKDILDAKTTYKDFLDLKDVIWESEGSQFNASVEYDNGQGIALVEVESGTVKDLSTGEEVISLEICVVAGYDEFCSNVGIDYEIDFDAGSASVNAVVGCGDVELLWGIATGEEELERVVTKGADGEAIVEIVLHKEIATVVGVVCGVDVNAGSFDGATLEGHRELQGFQS